LKAHATIPGTGPVLLQKKQVDQASMTQRQVVAGRPLAPCRIVANEIFGVGADTGEAPVTVAHYLGSPRS
jgi:hypothetical protein